MTADQLATGRLMTPAEVARVFRVDKSTVTRWGGDGRLRSVSTPGGHRRFHESDVRAFLTNLPAAEAADPDEAALRHARLLNLAVDMLSTFVERRQGSVRSSWVPERRVAEWRATYRRLS